MSVNDASRIISDDSRVMLQIVVSLTDDSRVNIYNCNMFIAQANDILLTAQFIGVIYSIVTLTSGANVIKLLYVIFEFL